MSDTTVQLQQLEVIGKACLQDSEDSANATEQVEQAMHAMPGPVPVPVCEKLSLNSLTTATTTATTIALATTATPATSATTTATTTETTTATTTAAAATQTTTSTVSSEELRSLGKYPDTRWGRMLRVLSRCIVYCSVRVAAGFGISRQQAGWYKHCWDTPGSRPRDISFLVDREAYTASGLLVIPASAPSTA
ncbi:hypothetical protein KR222_005013 [Zaprionus bogoriensis]|nr:hypothetical protein KR222_005013 [Zaprionus bogoriensis]